MTLKAFQKVVFDLVSLHTESLGGIRHPNRSVGTNYFHARSELLLNSHGEEAVFLDGIESLVGVCAMVGPHGR